MLSIRTILHPTDFSEQSEYAYQVAKSLARDYGARLMVIHVLMPPPFVSHREMERAMEEPDGHLRELRGKLRELSHNYQLLEGDPALEIAEAAKRVEADLVVMGTHGRTGLSRVLVGSVAEGVMRQAPCPVLTVKKPMGYPTGAEELTETGKK
jgi:universal stress protein A